MLKRAKSLISVVMAVMMVVTSIVCGLSVMVSALVTDSMTTENITFESNDSTYPWTEDTKLGTPAVKSGNKEIDSSTSTMTFSVEGSGLVDVTYFVSSEGAYDGLKIYVDDTMMLFKSGTSMSEFETSTVKCFGEGTHAVKLSFTKDGSEGAGEDCAWVSAVRFTQKEVNYNAYIGETPYLTVGEAVEAANQASTDTTITLGDNSQSSVEINNVNKKTITLDLNGYVLSAVQTNNFDVYTPLVLTDSKIADGTGKYTCAYENTFYNDNTGRITIDNAVIENTYTTTTTATIFYWPLTSSNVIVKGSGTKIIFDPDHCKYTLSSANIVISAAAYLSADPTAYVDTSKYVVNDGGGYYYITEKPVVKYWKDYADADDVSIDGDIYTVSSAAGLAYIASLCNNTSNDFSGKTVVLSEDIDLSVDSRYWTPIGTSSKPFKGTFDGGDHRISGLKVVSVSARNGLFAKVTNATIKNIILDSPSVSGNAFTAALVGQMTNSSVSNVTVCGDIGIVAGSSYTGIICGHGYGDFTSCNVIATKGDKAINCGDGKNGYFVGGIVGYWGAGTMTDCHTYNLEISADYGVGGLVGVAMGDASNKIIYSSVEDSKFDSTYAYGGTMFGGALGAANNEKINISKSYVKNIVIPDDTTATGYIVGDGANLCSGTDVCYANVTATNESLTDENSVHSQQSAAAAKITDDNEFDFSYYIGTAADIEGNSFASLDNSIDSAQDGSQITITGNIDEFVTEPVEVSKNITINFGTFYDDEKTYITVGTGYQIETETVEGNVIVTVSEIQYPVTFLDKNGNTLATDYYTINDGDIEEPTVPEIDGYTCSWESYTLDYSDNIVVKPVYTAITYTATFVDENGETVDVKNFTVEDSSVSAPEVPVKDGYYGEWEAYTLGLEDITIHPVYSEKVFNVTTHLTNCEMTNGSDEAKYGVEYTATISPSDDTFAYPLCVIVKVDGKILECSKYSYDRDNGSLVIKAEAVSGDIEISATSCELTDGTIIWTKNESRAYYVVEGKGTVYTNTVTKHKAGSDVTFRVVLLAKYNKSNIVVYNNGIEVEPNEDGSYTLHNVTGGNLILISGIISNKASSGIMNGLSITDWVIQLIQKILDFFKSFFD